MIYRILWRDHALDDLNDLPAVIGLRISKKIETHLARDPMKLGSPLTGQLSGLFRYRIGDYRVIYEIHRDQLIIYVLRVGHRKDIYDE